MAVFKAKTATKDGRKWYFSVCYQTANGERKRKKGKLYATKAEAGEAERQFLVDKTFDRVDITLEEMYHQYLNYTEEYIKGSSKYCKDGRIQNHILPYFGKMNIHEINFGTVIDWKDKINKTVKSDGKPYAVSYKRTLFVELHALLNYGKEFCQLKENVATKVKNFSEKTEEVITDEEKLRYITPDEYHLFTSVIDDIVYKVFFAFLYYMGVRRGEAQALTWEDILWKASQVRIIKTITCKTLERDKNGFQYKITNTKNLKNRKIEMPDALIHLMAKLYQYYRKFEGFNDEWFVFGGYRHLAGTTINRRKNSYFKLVEKTYGKAINNITNHEFRHSHASYLISNGISAEYIAKRLGDTVAIVLDVYAHLFPETEKEIIEKLNLIESKKYLFDGTKKESLESQPAIKILQAS